MTKSPSSVKRIVKPPLDRFGGVRVVQRRIQKSEIIEHSKDKVAQELIDIATANINDIVDWDDTGYVKVKNAADISEAAIKAIKKIKMTPTALGPQIEVELHDKVSVLRVLAKASGLLEQQENMDKPSVVGIIMHGPAEPIVDIEGDYVDKTEENEQTGADDSTKADTKEKNKL